MTTHTGLRLGAVALVILSIALVSGAHLCGVALDKAATDPGMRPIGSGALACTEFWLNRYQTLIGAVAALAAAGVAWIGVRRQIAKADEQISVANRQSSIAILSVLDQRTESAIKAFRFATALESFHFDMSRVSDIAFARAANLHEYYYSGDTSLRFLAALKETVEIYIKQADEFSTCLGGMTEELARGLGGPVFRMAGQDLWVGATDFLNAHRAAIDILVPCTEEAHLPVDQAAERFAAARRFDRSNFAALDRVYANSLEILAGEVIIMQSERDRVFEQSRA